MNRPILDWKRGPRIDWKGTGDRLTLNNRTPVIKVNVIIALAVKNLGAMVKHYPWVHG